MRHSTAPFRDKEIIPQKTRRLLSYGIPRSPPGNNILGRSLMAGSLLHIDHSSSLVNSSVITHSILNEEYQVEGTLGQGQFGRTLKVLYRDGLYYALKRTRTNVRQSLLEAHIASKLSCPTCITCYRCWSEQGSTFFMTDIAHCSLETVLDAYGFLCESFIWLIMADISHALQYLWKNSLVHLDVKPSNVLVTHRYPGFNKSIAFQAVSGYDESVKENTTRNRQMQNSTQSVLDGSKANEARPQSLPEVHQAICDRAAVPQQDVLIDGNNDSLTSKGEKKRVAFCRYPNVSFFGKKESPEVRQQSLAEDCFKTSSKVAPVLEQYNTTPPLRDLLADSFTNSMISTPTQQPTSNRRTATLAVTSLVSTPLVAQAVPKHERNGETPLARALPHKVTDDRFISSCNSGLDESPSRGNTDFSDGCNVMKCSVAIRYTPKQARQFSYLAETGRKIESAGGIFALDHSASLDSFHCSKGKADKPPHDERSSPNLSQGFRLLERNSSPQIRQHGSLLPVLSVGPEFFSRSSDSPFVPLHHSASQPQTAPPLSCSTTAANTEDTGLFLSGTETSFGGHPFAPNTLGRQQQSLFVTTSHQLQERHGAPMSPTLPLLVQEAPVLGSSTFQLISEPANPCAPLKHLLPHKNNIQMPLLSASFENDALDATTSHHSFNVRRAHSPVDPRATVSSPMNAASFRKPENLFLNVPPNDFDPACERALITPIDDSGAILRTAFADQAAPATAKALGLFEKMNIDSDSASFLTRPGLNNDQLPCSDVLKILSSLVFTLADFGLSQAVPFGPSDTGDSRYVCPHFLATGVPSHSSDLYSFGIMMLEILTNIDLPTSGPMFEAVRSGSSSVLAYLDPLLFGSNLHEYVYSPEGTVELSFPEGASTPVIYSRELWHAVLDLLEPAVSSRISLADWMAKWDPRSRSTDPTRNIYNEILYTREATRQTVSRIDTGMPHDSTTSVHASDISFAHSTRLSAEPVAAQDASCLLLSQTNATGDADACSRPPTVRKLPIIRMDKSFLSKIRLSRSERVYHLHKHTSEIRTIRDFIARGARLLRKLGSARNSAAPCSMQWNSALVASETSSSGPLGLTQTSRMPNRLLESFVHTRLSSTSSSPSKSFEHKQQCSSTVAINDADDQSKQLTVSSLYSSNSKRLEQTSLTDHEAPPLANALPSPHLAFIKKVSSHSCIADHHSVFASPWSTQQPRPQYARTRFGSDHIQIAGVSSPLGPFMQHSRSFSMDKKAPNAAATELNAESLNSIVREQYQNLQMRFDNTEQNEVSRFANMSPTYEMIANSLRDGQGSQLDVGALGLCTPLSLGLGRNPSFSDSFSSTTPSSISQTKASTNTCGLSGELKTESYDDFSTRGQQQSSGAPLSITSYSSTKNVPMSHNNNGI